MHRLRMIMLCGSLACILETFLEIIVGIKQSAFSIVVTALNLALILTFYKPELKELINKIMGNDDDDFRGGNYG
jgi:ascorbate-specific PTS system EIIC-type component UlaA